MQLQRSALASLLVAGALATSACGASNESGGSAATPSGTGGPALAGTLNGVGASSQESAMEAWRAGFGSANEGVTVNYDPAGSSAGREQFLAGGAVDFAGSDAALDDEELAAGMTRCEGGSAINLPLYVSPIAVIYNLEGVDELNLSPGLVADIFNQQITTWNDPQIAMLNPDADLPDTAITPVNRMDGSGTTQNFTEYLAAAAGPQWPYEPDSEFPVMGGESATGTSGLVDAVTNGDGTIGYADFSRAGDLGVANIQIGEEFVAPSPEGAATTVENSERVAGRPAGDISLDLKRVTDDPAEYPVTLVTYSVVCTSYSDAAKGNLIKGFFTYVASEEGQAAAAENAGSAPISSTLQEEITATVSAITAG